MVIPIRKAKTPRPRVRRKLRPWRLALALLVLALLVTAVIRGVAWLRSQNVRGQEALIRVEDAVLYTLPDQDSQVLASLSPGDVLTLVEQDDGWYKVTLEDKTGYVKQSAAMILESGVEDDDVINDGQGIGIVDTGIQDYGYQQMMDDLTLFAQRWPDVVTVETLYTTVGGRKTPLVKIGNPNADHRIWVDASIHAREYMSTQIVMRQLELLLSNLKDGVYQGRSLTDTLDDVCLYVLPMVNPDGVELCQQGLDSVPEDLQEAVLAMNGGSTDFSRWKANLNGVDLNNNFDARWDEASTDVTAPCSASYKGTAPFSEVETQAIKKLMEHVSFDMTISYHCVGGEIYWWFYQTGSQARRDRSLANTFSGLTGYTLVSQDRSMESSAGLKDWSVSTFGVPGLTIELGPAGGPAPIDSDWFPAVWRCNRLVIWRALNEVAGGF